MIFGRRNKPEPIARRMPLRKLERAPGGIVVPPGWRAVILLGGEVLDVLESGPRPLDHLDEPGRPLLKNKHCIVELVTASERSFDLVGAAPRVENLAGAPPIELTARVVIDRADQFVLHALRPARLDRPARLWERLNAELNDLLPALGPAASADERMQRIESRLDAALERIGMRLLQLTPRGADPAQVESAQRRAIRRRRIEQQLLDQMLNRQLDQQREAMLREVREQDLLAARQLEDLETALAEDREDHTLAREHFKARLALLNDHELNMLRLDQFGERSRAEQTVRLAREQAEHTQDAAEVEAALRWRGEKHAQDRSGSTPPSTTAPASTAPADPWRCAACGQPNRLRHKYCTHCGARRGKE